MYNMPKPVVTKRKNNGSLEVIEDTKTGSSSGDVARPMGCKKLKALEQRARQNEVGESIAARLKDLLELNEKKLLQNKLAVHCETFYRSNFLKKNKKIRPMISVQKLDRFSKKSVAFLDRFFKKSVAFLDGFLRNR
ncbi:hypothetical protein INT47_003845 [Mucor saturninus]|uniref:Uncharacterized protein n=1 Tax=Mucor saturninus TaxID=64648 RepID=A0A8H7UUP0_9FUNG|nr:hypothetical protein INT47_003845 [Mucor saturninus]